MRWPGQAAPSERTLRRDAPGRPGGSRALGVASPARGGWHGGAWDGRLFLPHSPDVGELLRGAREAGLLELAAPLDVRQLAVGLVSVTGGGVPQVLTALGVHPAALRAAVAETGEPGGA